MAQIMFKLDRKDIEKELAGYQVFVEMYDKAQSGAGRRKFVNTFNDAERLVIGKYYTTFYSWYLKTGLPESFTIAPKSLALLQRAINFFGEL